MLDLSLVNYYQALTIRQTLAQVQTAVLKQSLNLNAQLAMEIINQMSQTSLNNNPSNTGQLLDIRV
jgi:hypothetical protein